MLVLALWLVLGSVSVFPLCYAGVGINISAVLGFVVPLGGGRLVGV